MNPVELRAIEKMVGHQINVFRLSADVRNQVVATLTALEKQLGKMLKSKNLTDYKQAQINKLLGETSTVIKDYYATAEKLASANLVGAAKVEAKHTIGVLAEGAVLPTEGTLKAANKVTNIQKMIVQGAPYASWWARQSQDTAFRFGAALRQGIAAGQTREQIVATVLGDGTKPGILAVSKANARALVYTAMQTITNDARMETYRANKDVIRGVRQVSTLDGKTSVVCAAYAGSKWDLNGKPIEGTTLPFNGGVPRHWNCRSVLVPIADYKGVFGKEPTPVGTKAAVGGTVPIDMTFSDWLKTRSLAQQNAQFGAGRAELWRQGKLTLSQLLDLSGNPMTLAELENSIITGTAARAAAKASAAAQKAAEKAAEREAAEKAAEASVKAAKAAEEAAAANAKALKAAAEARAAEEAAKAATQQLAAKLAQEAAEKAAAEAVKKEVETKGPMSALKAWQAKVAAEKAAGTYVKPSLSSKQVAWQEKQKQLVALKKAEKQAAKAAAKPGSTFVPPHAPKPAFSPPAPAPMTGVTGGVKMHSNPTEAGVDSQLFFKAQEYSKKKWGYAVQIPEGFKLGSGSLQNIGKKYGLVTPEAQLAKLLNLSFHQAKGLVAAKASASVAKHEALGLVGKFAGKADAAKGFHALTAGEKHLLMDKHISAFSGQKVPGMESYKKAEAAALESYTGSAYSQYNAALRAKQANPNHMVSPGLWERIVAARNGLQRNGLQQDALLFRGIKLGTAENYARIAREQGLDHFIGKTIVDNGFASTSVSRDVALRWSGDNGTLLQILASKGTPGAYVQAISRHKSEEEWLLPPGMKMLIEKAEWVQGVFGEAKLQLTVRIVPIGKG